MHDPRRTTAWKHTTKHVQGLGKEDVDLLLLAGAASRVPKLQAWLQGA